MVIDTLSISYWMTANATFRVGTWYILTSADHNTVQINRINSDGTIGDRVNYLAAGAYEAPGLIKVGGVYFLIVSGKTGWRSNPNKMFYATSITGEWTGPADVAPQAENTYNSQNTFELTIKGSQTTTYIYMGDSWDSQGGPDSNYIWLPMNINSASKTLTLQYYPQWKVDVNTGVVSTPSLTRRYEAEHAILSGRAGVASCADCLTKRAVHKIDDDSPVVFRNVTGAGGKQWVQFHYTVSDPKAGEAHVLVNDGDVPMNISSMNSRAGYHKTVPVELDLKEGSVNTITFGAVGGQDYEIMLEGIEVVEDEL